MQTFLPYANYRLVGIVLDPKRLGNQVYREGLTILNGGWPHHPASKMWHGYERELCKYLRVLARFIKTWDTSVKWEMYFKKYPDENNLPNTGKPPWLGDDDFHASHRSNLLRKDPVWYGRFNWKESDDLPYVWPV